MDRKSIVLLVAAVLLIFSWPLLMRKFYPPAPVSATNTVATVTNVAPGQSNAPAVTTTTTAAEKITPVDKNTPEETLSITNENAVYTFTSHGGGLKQVTLLKYPAATNFRAEKSVSTNTYATLNSEASVAAMVLTGSESLQGDGIYSLSHDGKVVRAEKSLPNGLHVVKEFSFGSNYLVSVKARLENKSQQTLNLPPQEWTIGAAAPMSTRDDGTYVGFHFYNGDKAEDVTVRWFAGGSFMGCGTSTPKSIYQADANIVWADTHNQFFTLATIPKQPAQKIVSRIIDLPNAREIVAANQKGITNGLQTSIVYPQNHLVAGQALDQEFTIYAGPKEYNTLAKIAGEMKNNLDLIMSFGWAGFVAKFLLLSMNGLHALFGGALNYGWIIILITVLIKLIFWPLTSASTKSMKRMQAYQPQLKALQEKYKDDPAKLSRKQMEFFKEHKINPMGGCLPMLIQIPVFIGFYTMIRTAIELRGVHFLWALDLSQPDTVGYLGGFPINILPIIYGLTLLYQARITPVSPTMDPGQQQMMKYMPLMFLFILYNMSAGLTLYWTVQNSLTILQTKLTKTSDTTTPDGKTNVEIIPPKKKK